MKRLLLAFLALVLAAPVQATSLIKFSSPSTVGLPCTMADGSKFVCPSATLTDSTGAELGTSGNPVNVTSTGASTAAAPGSDATNATAVQGVTGGKAVSVGGNVASGASDSGNGVKTACVFNTSLPTVTTGQRVDSQCTAKGTLAATLYSPTGSALTIGNANAAGLSASNNFAYVQAIISLWNGSTADAGFICPNTASVSVTAGNTTEIVALTSAQVVRVCSVTLGIATTGTVGVVYGTGTNCGTGTTTLVADMNLTAGNLWAQTGPAGGSLFRSATANAICVKAVTGDVKGSLTYAKY